MTTDFDTSTGEPRYERPYSIRHTAHSPQTRTAINPSEACVTDAHPLTSRISREVARLCRVE